MKKILLSLAILFSAGYGYSASFNDQYEDWRSSGITVAIDSMFLSSGAIYVKDITVASGTVTGGTLTIFNSTGTDSGITRSTFSVVLDIDTSGTIYEIDKIFTKGFGCTKTGTSQIYIRYNYPYIIPTGKESFGY